LLAHLGYDEKTILTRGIHAKGDVALTLTNNTDRSLSFVVFDCVHAFREEGSQIEQSEKGLKSWPIRRDIRNVKKGKPNTWANFDEFRDPTGWFALYVRYDHSTENRVVQQALGVYNFFNNRGPKVVVEPDWREG